MSVVLSGKRIDLFYPDKRLIAVAVRMLFACSLGVYGGLGLVWSGPWDM